MTGIWLMLSVFVFCSLAGYLLISRVPQLLHTPLMSMTNAISGVTVIAAILLFTARTDVLQAKLGAVAVAMASFNVVGGFAITDRMLRLFKREEGRE